MTSVAEARDGADAAAARPVRAATSYDAFLSYSHASDDALAPAIQSALHRLARPWYRRRALRVFRDRTSLSANPALWPAIERALSQSAYFLLMASPAAAASPWVRREVAWWLEHRSPDHLLILWTEGQLVWNGEAGDFDWERTTALPPDLRGRFTHEPLWVDLRWAHGDRLSLRHGPFRAAVLDVATPLHGKPKEDLDGDDVRRYRAARRLAVGAVSALVVLTAAAVSAAAVARSERTLAVSRELAATATLRSYQDGELAVLLALEALDRARTREAEEALRQSLIRLDHDRVVREAITSAWSTRQYGSAVPDDTVRSPDLTLAAVLDGTSIRITDAESGGVVAELDGHSDEVMSFAFSPDSRWLASASLDETARIWDARTGVELAVLDAHGAMVLVVGWSPDGRWLVTGGLDRAAHVFEAGTWTARATFDEHDGAVDRVAFSSDSRYAVTGSTAESYGIPVDRSARVWEVATGLRVFELGGHESGVSDAAFSADDRFVVTQAGLGPVHVWSMTTGDRVNARPPLEPGQPVLQVVAGEQDRTGEGDIGIAGVGFDLRGTKVLAVNTQGSATIVDLLTGEQLCKAVLFSDGENPRFAFSNDGRLLRSVERDTLKAWDANTCEQLPWPESDSAAETLRSAPGSDDRLILGPDGRYRIALAPDSAARIVTENTDETIGVLPGHESDYGTNMVSAAAFSADGRFIATASHHAISARVYRWESFAPLEDLLALAESRVGRKLSETERAAYRPASIMERMVTAIFGSKRAP